MQNYKKIVLSLALLMLPMVHGCDNEDTSMRKPSKRTSQDIKAEQREAEKQSKLRAELKVEVEAKIYSKLKSMESHSFRVAEDGGDFIEDRRKYYKLNLTSVKIANEMYSENINLFYKETPILKDASIVDNTYLLSTMALNIGKKNNLYDPKVKLYINNRLLSDVRHEEYEKGEAEFRKAKNRVMTAKEVSTLESKLYAELKDNNGSYRSILGDVVSDEEIVYYDNANLVSIKIINKPDVCKIKLFYDESLLKVSNLEDFSEPVVTTAYYFARKNKIIKSDVELYLNGKLLGCEFEDVSSYKR